MKREYALVAAVAVGQAAVKIAAGIAMIKALAVILGPGELAYFGQANSAYLLVAGLASVFLGSGLVAALARESQRPGGQAATLQVADRASLVLFASVAVLTAAAWWLAGDDWRRATPHADALLAAALAGVACQAIYTRSLSVLTATGEVPRYGALTTGYALATAAFVAAMAALAGLAGSVTGLVLASAAGAMAGVGLARGRLADPMRGRGGARELRMILSLGAFGLVGALAPQACQIVVRGLLIDGVSPAAAGIWHGMSRLSDAILGPVVTIVSLYFLPRFAKAGMAASGPALRQGLLTVVIPFAVLAVLLWWQRDVAVRIAFTGDFAAMRDLFAWQLTGDVVRVTGWLFAYCLLGAGLTVWLTVLEVGHVMVYIGAVSALLPIAADRAGSVGYLAANVVYLLAVATVYAAAVRRQGGREAAPA